MPSKVEPFERDDPLAALPNESDNAFRAFADYVAMGAGRSLTALLELYARRSQSDSEARPIPTRRIATLKGWSARFQWQARIIRQTELDVEQERAEWRAQRRKVLGGAFAKIALALNGLNPAEMNPALIMRSVQMIMGELRSEYDELPTMRFDMKFKPEELAAMSDEELNELARRLGISS